MICMTIFWFITKLQFDWHPTSSQSENSGIWNMPTGWLSPTHTKGEHINIGLLFIDFELDEGAPLCVGLGNKAFVNN